METKFRGLKADGSGEWVYGYYWHSLNWDCDFIKEVREVVGEGIIEHDQEVLKDTVGQFTGLTDKNGVEIYGAIGENGGDKLKIQLPLGGFWGDVKKQETGIVEYNNDKCGFIVNWGIFKYGKNQSYVRLDCDIAFFSEVIGNIHQNS